jgi:hypothetical protein
MVRGLLSKRQALRSPPLITPTCARGSYSVLARLSAGYPQLGGRLPTRYSPFRHSHRNYIAIAPDLVRLACLIHAASVRSEPESNSPKKICSQIRPAEAKRKNLQFELTPTQAYQSHHFRIESGTSVSFPSIKETRLGIKLFRFQRTNAIYR